MLKTNGNYKKTALETVKYEVHGGLLEPPPPQPPTLQKPKTSRGLIIEQALKIACEHPIDFFNRTGCPTY